MQDIQHNAVLEIEERDGSTLLEAAAVRGELERARSRVELLEQQLHERTLCRSSDDVGEARPRHRALVREGYDEGLVLKLRGRISHMQEAAEGEMQELLDANADLKQKVGIPHECRGARICRSRACCVRLSASS